MTYFQQPWGRFNLAGRRFRLQVLDPETAFEIEPDLIDKIGSELVMMLADPRTVLEAIGGAATSVHGLDGNVAAAMQDPEHGVEVSATALQLLSRVLTTAVVSSKIDGAWITSVFESFVFDRLKVDGRLIEDWSDWATAKLKPVDRWRLLSLQLSQTYRPLWVRSPYNVRTNAVKDYGVPLPKTPKAVQWAAALAAQGYASSPNEVLTSWTPERLLDVVESAAYQAENDARAQDAAKAASAKNRGR